MRDFRAKCGIYLDDDNNLQFLSHPVTHQYNDECYLFLCAVFHRARDEDGFFDEMIAWLKKEHKGHKAERKLQ